MRDYDVLGYVPVILAAIGAVIGLSTGWSWYQEWQIGWGPETPERLPVIGFLIPAIVFFFVGGFVGFGIQSLVNAVRKPGSPTAQASSPGFRREASPLSISTELLRLGELRDQGVITDAEFEQMKRKLIEEGPAAGS